MFSRGTKDLKSPKDAPTSLKIGLISRSEDVVTSNDQCLHMVAMPKSWQHVLPKLSQKGYLHTCSRKSESWVAMTDQISIGATEAVIDGRVISRDRFKPVLRVT